MRFPNLAGVFALAVVAISIAACGGSSQNDQAAIGEQNKKFLAAIVAKDAATIAQIYAEDGALLPPNAAKSAGRDAIQKTWTEFLQLPGMTLTFETETLVVAKSGDLAVDIGTYKSTIAGTNDTGKSVVTWVKRGDQWLILTDMFSSDLPPPAPAATPAPAAAEPATPATTTPETPAPTPN